MPGKNKNQKNKRGSPFLGLAKSINYSYSYSLTTKPTISSGFLKKEGATVRSFSSPETPDPLSRWCLGTRTSWPIGPRAQAPTTKRAKQIWGQEHSQVSSISHIYRRHKGRTWLTSVRLFQVEAFFDPKPMMIIDHFRVLQWQLLITDNNNW